MSCRIQSPENVAIIASFIKRLLDHGYNSFGFQANYTVFSAFNDCQANGFYNARMIYEKLYEANFKAYNDRYKIIPETSTLYQECIDAFQDIDIWKPRVVENLKDVPQEWHYRVFKNLQFLQYQILDNDTADNDPVFKALEVLIATLAMFIITHSKEYLEADWD